MFGPDLEEFVRSDDDGRRLVTTVSLPRLSAVYVEREKGLRTLHGSVAPSRSTVTNLMSVSQLLETSLTIYVLIHLSSQPSYC